MLSLLYLKIIKKILQFILQIIKLLVQKLMI